MRGVNMKYISYVIIFLIIIYPIYAEEPQSIDSNILRFMQQEEMKTRAEIKNHIIEQLEVNQDKIQEQVEYNRFDNQKETIQLQHHFFFSAQS